MKQLIVAGIVCALSASTHEVAAGLGVGTRWLFRVSDASGRSEVDSRTGDDVLIATPAELGWSCVREPVTPRGGGLLVGGFVCRSAAGFVSVTAACPARQDGWDSAAASLGHGDAHVKLEAFCVTRGPKTPLHRSIEADL